MPTSSYSIDGNVEEIYTATLSEMIQYQRPFFQSKQLTLASHTLVITILSHCQHLRLPHLHLQSILRKTTFPWVLLLEGHSAALLYSSSRSLVSCLFGGRAKVIHTKGSQRSQITRVVSFMFLCSVLYGYLIINSKIFQYGSGCPEPTGA
jgi:hypothetical protein